MILNKQTITALKEKSGLAFDKAKDFTLLADKIFYKTGRTIGHTTIKRLLGYISDDRNTNDFTLNTIAMYLGYSSWEEYLQTNRVDSDQDFEDDALYIDACTLGQKITVKYLDREVTFDVIDRDGNKLLSVVGCENGSLQSGDILKIHRIKVGERLEAEQVWRGERHGNYRTNGGVVSYEVLL